jgi:hypothetical protein
MTSHSWLAPCLTLSLFFLCISASDVLGSQFPIEALSDSAVLRSSKAHPDAASSAHATIALQRLPPAQIICFDDVSSASEDAETYAASPCASRPPLHAKSSYRVRWQIPARLNGKALPPVLFSLFVEWKTAEAASVHTEEQFESRCLCDSIAAHIPLEGADKILSAECLIPAGVLPEVQTVSLRVLSECNHLKLAEYDLQLSQGLFEQIGQRCRSSLSSPWQLWSPSTVQQQAGSRLNEAVIRSSSLHITDPQATALCAFYGSTYFDGWNNSTYWCSPLSVCDWYGLQCKNPRNGIVTSMLLGQLRAPSLLVLMST